MTFALFMLAMVGAPSAVPVGEAAALNDFRTYCARSRAIWGKSLCGPVVLVDPASRRAIANEDPGTGGFVKTEGVWAGTLPASIGTANTSIEWAGRRWAEVMLPLPEDKVRRRILLAHESFHRVQPELGFKTTEGQNAHLDTKDARILARLEAAALKRALTSKEWRAAARDALGYRAARLGGSKEAAEGERALINNEGLAEYTGIVVGAAKARTAQAVAELDSVGTRASLVRTLGYVVGPAYGLLLDRSRPGWRRESIAGEALPDLLRRTLAGFNRAPSLTRYGDAAIAAEETARDTRLQEERRSLSARLVDGPTVTFRFEKMGIEFNPNNLFSLGDSGTVYRGGATVHDSWGKLTVRGDVLVSSRWDFARVAGPATVRGQVVAGPDWEATLADGYGLARGPRQGDMVIAKLP